MEPRLNSRASIILQPEAAVSDTDNHTKHWSDQKADAIAVLTIMAALVLAAVHFISNQV